MKRGYYLLIAVAGIAAAGIHYSVSRSEQPAAGLVRGLLSRVSSLGVSGPNILTGGYGNGRTNANLNEVALTPAAVKPGSFGKLFSLAVDGQIYAQPLYMQGVTIAGKDTRNVVFTATMHNTVYAFDADNPALPLWSVNLGPAVPTSNYSNSVQGDYTDIQPENGVLSTPVVDPATGTLYVVAATLENGKYFYRLHALDTGSGQERLGGPVTIGGQLTGTGAASQNGALAFDAAQHLQRPALLLVNGNVYVAFGSHGDSVPFHGWIMGYSAQDIQKQVSVFTATPNGGGGSFWQAGRGLSADDDGNIFAVSSNGDTDMTANFGDTVLRLDSSATKVADWFAPANVQDLNDSDDDLGTTGAVLIPGTNYMVTAGKEGVMYLLDRTKLGHAAAGDAQIPQKLDTGNYLIFNMAVWNRPDGPLIYTHAANSSVLSFRLLGGKLSSAPVAASRDGFAVPFQGMTLSANGGQAGTGVLWVLSPSGSPRSPAVLHAYNADDLSEVWNSQTIDTDAVGRFSKFANPTVANGKVYVPTGSSQLVVYGLTGNGAVGNNPLVTAVVNAASYANGPLAPGEIVAIIGQNLGPQTAAAGAPGDNGLLSAQLAGTQVTFNGIPGPLLSTSSGLITAIVPYEATGAAAISIVVSYGGKTSTPQSLPAAAVAPGIFSSDASGSGPGSIRNADYTTNSPDKPAAQGSIVVVSATGGGATNPPAITGSVTTADAKTVADVSVTVGGLPARIYYAGNSIGQVAGAMQVNLRLPAGVTGTVPVVLTVGGQSSQSTVTVSVQ